MDSLWTQLALVAVLVTLNALFAGSELALVSLRDSQLNRLEQEGGTGALLARLARDPNRFFATIQIGITLAGFLASATAAVSLAEPLVEPLSTVLGTAARPASIVLITLLLTYVTLVFGELAPKRVAMQTAERWGLLAARPLNLLGTLARPAVWFLGVSTDLVVRLAGKDPDATGDEISEDELRDMVATQPELDENERLIIDGAFEFADRRLRQIITPRTRMVVLDETTAAKEARQVLADTGHTRAPVIRGDVDHVTGTVHLRDLVGKTGPVGEVALPVLPLPETLGCLDALRRMQAERQQMALVVDEHGGIEGLVTIEDLVEELVGEIWDEADPDVRSVERRADGSFVVVGTYPIHDLDDLGIDLPEGDYTTIGGLVMAELGRVPEVGDQVERDGWQVQVLESTTRTVERVHISPMEPIQPE
ncbi:hemolysin family protein [Euzebya tangerina]|uniref:hemolysin family protein n=1 Tax=Euzebya tangerina TaxID=591198 RepID=UPI000E31CE83|nr:hemolysin family protein [Euzebya tangerina]